MKRIYLFAFLVGSFLMVGAGCNSAVSVISDGGVFKSIDSGTKWQQAVGLFSVGQPKNIGGANVKSLIFDPQASNILYLITQDGLAFVSYDNTQAWQQIEGLPKGAVNAIAVDPITKSVNYVAIGGKVFKSLDCCHSWQNIYLEALPTTEITSLAIDPANDKNILLGVSDGRLIRSVDGGLNWSILYTFKAKIKQIIFNPSNSNIIYINTDNQGLWRSGDGGTNWLNIFDSLKNYPGAQQIDLVLLNRSQNDGLMIVTTYGILRSDNGGVSWTAYKLLSPAGRVKITALGFNPKNLSEIYYTTSNTFYRSFDGGNKWQTRPLPSRRTPSAILVDPNQTNLIYMGFASAAK
ncbi:MAG: hypothetical protein NTY61_00345 [Candidatus Parcubacteria bacterium]|nr:hypothetical protein [Candidatus Parcubacteria bacterium]